MLSESHEAPEIVSASTYERLIETADGKLRPETLQKLVDSGDPFTLPEQKDTDLATLQKHLRELKGLMEKKGWNTPEVRQAILFRMATRAGALQRQSVDLAKKVNEQWLDFSLTVRKFGNPPAHAVSPDGRYVAVMDVAEDFFVRTPAGGFPLQLVDRVSGETRVFQNEVYPDLHGRMTFSPDSQHLYFFTEKQHVIDVPIVEGVPQWDRKLDHDLGELAGPLEMPQPGTNPRYVFSGNKTILQRVDLTTGKITKVPLTKELRLSGMKIKRVGSVGQTDSIYAFEEFPSQGGRIFRIDFDANGDPRPAVRLAEWPQGYQLKDLTFTPEGKLITQHGSLFFEWPTPVQHVTLFETTGTGILLHPAQPAVRLGPVALHPEGAAAIYSDTNGGSWVELVNFAKPHEPKLLRLDNHARQVAFSPDGQMLITKHGAKTKFTNFRLQTQ